MKKAKEKQSKVAVNPLEKRVERLEHVLKALLNSYNGQIKAARVGADAFSPSMAEIEEL